MLVSTPIVDGRCAPAGQLNGTRNIGITPYRALSFSAKLRYLAPFA